MCSCSALGNYSLFLFYSTGFVPSSLSRLRPNQMPRYVTVVSSFVRLLRRLDSNPRAVSWECRRADLMTSWNNSLTHSRLLHSFLPSQSSKESEKKILTWFLFLFFCPATLTLAKLSCVSSVRRLMLSLSCPVPSLTLANPTLLQLLPHAPLFLSFSCVCLSPVLFFNLYLYFIFTKIYTNRLRIVINFN